jgi:hypothetical protein
VKNSTWSATAPSTRAARNAAGAVSSMVPGGRSSGGQVVAERRGDQRVRGTHVACASVSRAGDRRARLAAGA